MTPNSHISAKQGCPVCGKEKKISTFKKMRDECELTVFDRAREIFSDKYDFSKFQYENINKKSIVVCREHGDFMQSMNKLLYRKQGCPECAKLKTLSSFEQVFKEILEESKEKFSHQFRFPYRRLPNQKYSFDFFLPNYNMLVELHGAQHYEKKFNMTDEDLQDRQRKDRLKVDEAIDSGYNMLVIGKGFSGKKVLSHILQVVVQRLANPDQTVEGSSVHCKPTAMETAGSSKIFFYEKNEDEDIV